MRHVNPVRQSGPLPSYYGTYTMEDIKKLFDQTTMGKDVHYCQMDVDEVMLEDTKDLLQLSMCLKNEVLPNIVRQLDDLKQVVLNNE